MPPVPRNVQVGIRFAAMHPFEDSIFESTVMPLGGKLMRGTASKDDGTQFPIVAMEGKSSTVLYSASTGLLTFESPTMAETRSLIDRVLLPLLATSNLTEADLSFAETTTIFVVQTQSTALTTLGKAMPPVPEWAKRFTGEAMHPWGFRYVPQTAVDARVPFRTITPWFEVTLEPFADNPRNIFIRVIIRVKTWTELRDRLERMPTQIEEMLEEMVK